MRTICIGYLLLQGNISRCENTVDLTISKRQNLCLWDIGLTTAVETNTSNIKDTIHYWTTTVVAQITVRAMYDVVMSYYKIISTENFNFFILFDLFFTLLFICPFFLLIFRKIRLAWNKVMLTNQLYKLIISDTRDFFMKDCSQFLFLHI